MEPSVRRDLARFAAPAAFLVAITILVVLVHSALSSGGETTTAAQTATRPRDTTTRARTTTKKQQPATTGTTTSTTTAGAQLYTIQSGDTFGSIAAREGTTIGALEELNPDVNPNALTVGQQIRIK
jgi:LysM repeat protein